MALLMVNAPVQLENTRSAALAVTAVTLANPGVATSTAHGLSNGDVVVFSVSAGMVELNEQAVRIANVATDTFELEGLDTTNFTAWTAGDAFNITAWHTLCNSTGVDLPNNPPNRVPTTTLCDTKETTSIGLAGEVSGTIPIQDAPGNAGMDALSALPSGATRVMRQQWSTGEEKVFNSQPVYGGGYSGNVGDVTTGQIDVTLKGRQIMSYAAP